MKKLSVVLALLAMQGAIAATPELDFIGRISKEIYFAEHNQTKVWPGFHPAATPSVIQFERENKNTSQTWAYALNVAPHDIHWSQVASAEYPIYFLEDAKILNLPDLFEGTFLTVDGQKSFVEPEDAESYIAIENLFNQFMLTRAELYFKNEMVLDPKQEEFIKIKYDRFNNVDFMKSIYLEDAALTLAQQDDTGLAEDALRDAVAIHQYRNSLATPEQRTFENGSEFIFGTPYFVSWSSRNLSEENYRKMTQRTGCLPLESMLGVMGMIQCAGQINDFASAVYGHALDKKIENGAWKRDMQTQFKSASQMAINHYHFSDAEAKGMAQAALQKPAYHYDRVTKIVEHAMLPYIKSLSAAKEGMQQTPGIQLRTNFPVGMIVMMLSNFMQTFDEMYYVDNHTMLFTNVSVSSPDQQDPIEIRLPYLSLNYEFERFDLASFLNIFKVDEDMELIIDDQKYMVRDFIKNVKVKSFDKIVLKDSHITLPLDVPGELSLGDDGELKLMVDENDANNNILQKFHLKNADLRKVMKEKFKLLH